MKSSIKTILIAVVLAVLINLVIVPYQTANAGVASFKTALISAFTANFTAPERTRIANAYIAEHKAEWDALIAGGMVDNATNRGSFTADQMIADITKKVRRQEQNAAILAVPTPSPLEP